MGAWEELDTEISVELDFSDLDELVSEFAGDEVFSDLSNYVEKLKTGWDKGSQKAVAELSNRNRSFQELYINRNCKNPSGMFASSITVIENSNYSYTIGTIINEIYPMSIEFGHREIVPVNAKALAFYSDSGELIFRKRVSSTNPRPFVAPAYEDTLKITHDFFMLEINHVIDSAG